MEKSMEEGMEEAERKSKERRYCDLLAAEKMLRIEIADEFSYQAVVSKQSLLWKAKEERSRIDAALREDNAEWMPECED